MGYTSIAEGRRDARGGGRSRRPRLRLRPGLPLQPSGRRRARSTPCSTSNGPIAPETGPAATAPLSRSARAAQAGKTSTSVAFTAAHTSVPSVSASSATAAGVTSATIVIAPATRTRTRPRAPRCSSATTVPGHALRALPAGCSRCKHHGVGRDDRHHVARVRTGRGDDGVADAHVVAVGVAAVEVHARRARRRTAIGAGS